MEKDLDKMKLEQDPGKIAINPDMFINAQLN